MFIGLLCSKGNGIIKVKIFCFVFLKGIAIVLFSSYSLLLCYFIFCNKNLPSCVNHPQNMEFSFTDRKLLMSQKNKILKSHLCCYFKMKENPYEFNYAESHKDNGVHFELLIDQII